MIRVARAARLDEVGVEALLRSVGSDLEPLTSLDRRLARQAGDEALLPLRAMGEMPVGGAVVTAGGDLPASLLIHVVLRSAEEAVSEGGVRRAFTNGLRHAAEWGIRSLGVLPLGIGAGNLDAEDSARIMLGALEDHRVASALPEEVVVLAATDYEEEAFRREAERRFPREGEPAP